MDTGLPPMSVGQKVLMNDLSKMMFEVQIGTYSDFASPHAAPKVELRNRLLKMADNVVEGLYD